jgi:hypothetical protein
LDLGAIPVQDQAGIAILTKKIAFSYLPWMEDARLVLDFSIGKNKAPVESKVLAKGVLAPQLLVRLGTYLFGEAIPAVGRFDFSEKVREVKPLTKSVSFRFEPESQIGLPTRRIKRLKDSLLFFWSKTLSSSP